MIILKIAARLNEMLLKERKAGKTIGFVPTMGALHSGHLSLINASLSSNDITVCSIFINPSQFNNMEDFNRYPVTIEKDIEMLEPTGCHILFLPPVNEIYPVGYQKKIYNLGDIESKLEGLYRPGHFQGVSEVVDQLLNIVQPNNLYLGQKDFQQCMVISKLLQITNRESQVALHIIPTLREADGLAMSSRNLRLDEHQRIVSAAISQQLFYIKEKIGRLPLAILKSNAAANLSDKGFIVDYVSIANKNDLSEASDESGPLVALIAATIGNIRLIDNVLLN